MSVLPPSILRCLRPEDRKSLGKAGLLPEEALAQMVIKKELDLQKQIVGLLRIKGIEPLVPIFGRKTRMAVGWPDITFAVRDRSNVDFEGYGERTVACTWELKIPGGRHSDEQTKMAVRLSTPPNAWRHRVIESFDQALEELKQMGIQ